MKPVGEWRVVGFTSEPNGHRHLLKHVLRTVEVEEAHPRDPEAWEELMTASRLPGELARRREVALTRLQRAPGCLAGKAGVTAGSACEKCQDRAAWHSITREMGDFMGDYVAAAAAALDHARANPDRYGARLLVFQGPERLPTVEAFDARHVKVVGTVDAEGHVRLVTCYRDRERSQRSHHLEMNRARAKHRRAGTLVEVG